MARNILAINLGSSSKKYAVFRNGVRLFSAHFEKTESAFAVSYDNLRLERIGKKIYDNALAEVVAHAKKKHNVKIGAVGVRVVAIGREFARHSLIGKNYLGKLKKETELDPAHLPQTLEELKKLSRLLPKVPVVAASDSAFHQTMPAVARRCAIPAKISRKNGIERTGFHGLSVSSAVSQIKNLLDKIPKRAIVCHMGNGVSVTALLNGKSVETSMGYSPLSGVPMSARVGDIDPEAVLRLAEKSGIKNTRRVFYSKSGLLALSGKSGDMRLLLRAAKNGDKASNLAIKSFVHHIKLFIGAYCAILGGVDALIFSGTMGVRSSAIRARVTDGLSHLGIAVNPVKNKKARPGDNIAAPKSRIKVFVLKADEEEEIRKAVGNFNW